MEDAASIRVMGFPVLEALPSRSLPYEQVDPFILLHEARLRLSDLADVDTKHPHRGFDNIWYVIEGSANTGHSTGPGGAMERALVGEATFGANRRPASPTQLVLLGPGDEFTVTDAAPGTRFMLMAAQPYGETPRFNGPYVD